MIFRKVNKQKENTKEDSVQRFVNVIDIKDKFLYTRDGYIISYIQVPSIDINLLSEREKRNKANTLTAEFSAIDKIIKFLAISRPVDISPLLSEYQQIYSTTSNLKQKELLRYEMQSISNFALSGEIVERQFYIMIWEKYQKGIEMDINKRAMEIISMFESASIKANILTEKDIVRLCNLINNPTFVNLEETSINQTMPFIVNF
mgnify:CR=1 FL=1